MAIIEIFMFTYEDCFSCGHDWASHFFPNRTSHPCGYGCGCLSYSVGAEFETRLRGRRTITLVP